MPKGVNMDMDMGEAEAKELAACEEVVERGLANFVEVGTALLRIRDARLYKSTHKSFPLYLKERWAMSKTSAQQLINAATVVSGMKTVAIATVPQSEWVARPLVAVPPEDRPEVWAKAVEIGNGKPTAKQVEQAVEMVMEKQETAGTAPEVMETPPNPAVAAPPEQITNFRPPRGLIFVRMAISQMERIDKSDAERDQAFELMARWLQENGGNQ